MIKNLLLTCGFFVFAILAYAQERTITGRIVDSDGGGLPGVSVVEKGTANGTITDIEGNYSISVPTGTTLIYSSVGMRQYEEAIGSRSVIDLVMEDDIQQLTEVIVTSLGEVREKKALGYAVSSLDSDELSKRSEADPIRSLSGKIPGVNIQGGGGGPGQSTKINIRGFSSMTGNTQPLFVVDGVPFDNSVNITDDNGFAQNSMLTNRAFDIDPNNIKSVSVLKGAAAAALYGSRAANGVIIITTKANTKSSKKGFEVTFSSSYSVEQIAGKPNYQNTYMQGSNQVYNGGYIGNWGAPFPNQVDAINAKYGTKYKKTVSAPELTEYYPEGWAPHPLTGIPRNVGQQVYFPDLLLKKGWKFDGNENFINGDGDPILTPKGGSYLAVPIRLQPHDNVGGFFQDGSLFENSLSVSSSSETTTVNFTLSNSSNEGIVPNSKLKRTAIGVGVNSVLDNGLFIQGSLNYVNTLQESPPSGASYNQDYGFGSGGSVFGRIFYLPRNFDLNGYPYKNPVNDANIFYRALDNPRWLTEYNKYQSEVNRAYANIQIGYDITDWLTVRLKGGVNQYVDERKDFRAKGGVGFPNGYSATDMIKNLEFDANLLLTAEKNITKDLNFSLTLGHNVNERRNDRYRAVGSSLIAAGITTSNNSVTQQTYETHRLQRFFAVYGDFRLSFKDYLFLNVLGRNDLSSTLPQQNNSYFYPSISSSFVFTDAFGISSNTLNFGKLRLSYAQVGNEAKPYRLLTNYSVISAYDGVSRLTLNDRLNNANLKNELTKEIEIGLETRLLSDRVNLDVTWFKRNSEDQIVNSDVARTSGFSSKVINSGDVQNSGWEITLGATPLKFDNGFEWFASVNFTKIKSEIIDAGEGGDIIISGDGSFPSRPLTVIHRTGDYYGQIYGTRFARDDEGNILIDKAQGTPIIDDGSHIVGNPNPDYIIGFNNFFSYKGFKLNILFDLKKGGDMVSYTAASLKLRGQLVYSIDREALRVVPGVYGDNKTKEPLLDNSGNKIQNTTGITSFDWYFSNGFAAYGPSEANVYDATVLRLREIGLSYNLPKKILSKTPFGSASVGVSARNLWYLAPNFPKDMNFDPEVLGSTSNSNFQGFDLGSTPTVRRFGANLTLTF